MSTARDWKGHGRAGHESRWRRRGQRVASQKGLQSFACRRNGSVKCLRRRLEVIAVRHEAANFRRRLIGAGDDGQLHVVVTPGGFEIVAQPGGESRAHEDIAVQNRPRVGHAFTARRQTDAAKHLLPTRIEGRVIG